MYVFNALTGQYRRLWLRGQVTKMVYRASHAWDATCQHVRRLFAEVRNFAEKIAP